MAGEVSTLFFLTMLTACVCGLEVFQPCSVDGEACPSLSTCTFRGCDGRICVCTEDTLPTEDHANCLKGTPLGAPCEPVRSVCMGTPFSECFEGVCRCLDGYNNATFNNRSVCFPDKSAGGRVNYGTCTEGANGTCPLDLVCRGSECTCPRGQRPATKKEVAASPFLYYQCRPNTFQLDKEVNLTGPECNNKTSSETSMTTTRTTTPTTTTTTTTPTTTTTTTPTTTTTTTTTPTTTTTTTPTTTTTTPTTTTTTTTTTPTTTTTTPTTTTPTTTTTTPTTTTQRTPTPTQTTIPETTTTTAMTTTTSTPTSTTTTPTTTTTTQTTTTSTTTRTPTTTPTLTTTTSSTTPVTKVTSSTNSSPTTTISTSNSLSQTTTTPTNATEAIPITTTWSSSTPSVNSSVIGRIGDNCVGIRCPENAECVEDRCSEPRCRCELGYAASPDRVQCWKLSALGESCHSGRICQGPFTQCSDDEMCECKADYELSDTGRWCRLKATWFIAFPLVGEECTGGFWGDCYLGFEQECRGDKCHCRQGLRAVDPHDRLAIFPSISQCRNSSYPSGEIDKKLCRNQMRTTLETDVYDRAKTKIRKVQVGIICGSVGFVALVGILIGVLVLIRWKRKGRRRNILDTSSTASTDGQSSRYSFKIPRPFATYDGRREYDSTHITYPKPFMEHDQRSVDNHPDVLDGTEFHDNFTSADVTSASGDAMDGTHGRRALVSDESL